MAADRSVGQLNAFQPCAVVFKQAVDIQAHRRECQQTDILEADSGDGQLLIGTATGV